MTEVPSIAHLLGNSSLPEQIIDVYFRLQPDQPRDKKDLNGYDGKLHQYNSPYQVSIYGAYPLMIDWNLLQHKIEKNVFSKTDVSKYLRLWAKGFKAGYFNFEKDYIKATALLFTDNQNYAQIIFDFATTAVGKNSFFARPGNFPERRGTTKHMFSGWEDSGKEAGSFYCAWYLILSNHKIFEPLFYKKNSETVSNIDNLSPTEPKTFQSYLTKKGLPVYEYLIDTFKDAKPQQISFMILALIELQYVSPQIGKNKTILHTALKNTFGKIGTRQALNLELYDSYYKDQIETIKKAILAAVNKK